MNDNVIRNKIKQFFKIQNSADLSRVDVCVSHNGEVVLEGIVQNREDKDFAEDVVKQMWDVPKLKSKLKVLSEATTVSLPPLHTVLQQV